VIFNRPFYQSIFRPDCNLRYAFEQMPLEASRRAFIHRRCVNIRANGKQARGSKRGHQILVAIERQRRDFALHSQIVSPTRLGEIRFRRQHSFTTQSVFYP
jgi:hypothetical protein